MQTKSTTRDSYTRPVVKETLNLAFTSTLNARLSKAPDNGSTESSRDELILLNDLLGEGWKCQLGYGKRSLIECALSLLKRIFGGRLQCRSFARQVHELITKISMLKSLYQDRST